MRASEQVTEQTVMKIARTVGLDTEQLRSDMQDPAIQGAIARTCSSRTRSGSLGRRASSSAIASCRGPSTSGLCRA